MAEKTCCVTGHRDIPENRISCVEQELWREVQTAIDDGYTRFISGFADGTDLRQHRTNATIRIAG